MAATVSQAASFPYHQRWLRSRISSPSGCRQLRQASRLKTSTDAPNPARILYVHYGANERSDDALLAHSRPSMERPRASKACARENSASASSGSCLSRTCLHASAHLEASVETFNNKHTMSTRQFPDDPIQYRARNHASESRKVLATCTVLSSELNCTRSTWPFFDEASRQGAGGGSPR